MKIHWFLFPVLFLFILSCNTPTHKNNPDTDSTDLVDQTNLEDIETDEPILPPTDSITADSIVMEQPKLPKEEASPKDCIDKSKINKDAMCTVDYNPVCGCNNKTYSNACMATNAGVTKYGKGECK